MWWCQRKLLCDVHFSSNTPEKFHLTSSSACRKTSLISMSPRFAIISLFTWVTCSFALYVALHSSGVMHSSVTSSSPHAGIPLHRGATSTLFRLYLYLRRQNIVRAIWTIMAGLCLTFRTARWNKNRTKPPPTGKCVRGLRDMLPTNIILAQMLKAQQTPRFTYSKAGQQKSWPRSWCSFRDTVEGEFQVQMYLWFGVYKIVQNRIDFGKRDCCQREDWLKQKYFHHNWRFDLIGVCYHLSGIP